MVKPRQPTKPSSASSASSWMKKEGHGLTILVVALRAYMTSHCKATRASPFSLVYGAETILHAKLNMPSARLALKAEVADRLCNGNQRKVKRDVNEPFTNASFLSHVLVGLPTFLHHLLLGRDHRVLHPNKGCASLLQSCLSSFAMLLPLFILTHDLGSLELLVHPPYVKSQLVELLHSEADLLHPLGAQITHLYLPNALQESLETVELQTAHGLAVKVTNLEECVREAVSNKGKERSRLVKDTEVPKEGLV
ncbi:hypothetical protein RHSIM_Rhsim09G0062100 [Rhododendron simsii]|uniref:Uncharacterized protein n=1 Tax=Rhododendron simsii TaxID=118357 RepID=A0A834GFJ6_RHOSS|nr:hypothetical protein RHSIM_Rhsim09G0062300 [Rhododendron simsii]KAF7132667.1 hypothetical protein RHSIM_Rhsim09G0062100 [Rhododendron simsii]